MCQFTGHIDHFALHASLVQQDGQLAYDKYLLRFKICETPYQTIYSMDKFGDASIHLQEQLVDTSALHCVADTAARAACIICGFSGKSKKPVASEEDHVLVSFSLAC